MTMWRFAIAVLGLTACDLVFRIQSRPDAVPVDGLRLVVPPDGPTTSAPPPPFEQWNYQPAQLPIIATGAGGDETEHIAFYTAADGVHAILQSRSQIGLWDGRIGDASAVAIAGFAGRFPAYAVLPDGAALVYQDAATQKLFIAVAGPPGMWTPTRTDLGFPNAFQIYPNA